MNRTLRSMRSLVARYSVLLIIAAFIPTVASAQTTGSVTGKITDSETGKPMMGATVRLTGIDVSSRRLSRISDRAGRYALNNITPGTYRLTVSSIGYTTYESGEFDVTAGNEVTKDAALKPGAVQMDEIVVSASRRPEKVTDAPASVSVVTARQVQERTALSLIDHVKGMQGVDIIQSGLSQSNVVTRGFNNIFSGTLTVLTDNRIAGVPSLRANIYNFIPLINEDIEQIEVVRGPGSALYGPNTANGVMNMITRSPFSSVGTTISVSGGERSVLQATLRHAGTIGDKFGYKISGQYMTGQDWSYHDPFEPTYSGLQVDSIIKASPAKDTLKQRTELTRIGRRDTTIQRVGGELRLDYLPMEDMTLIGSFGFNQAINNVDLTGIGAGQVKNWRYMYFQARMLYKDLFVQAFLNKSDAGQTYLLRTGQAIVDRSSQFVAQVQHSLHPHEGARLTYGADLILTNPITDSTITGKNEEDDNTTEVGAYLQGEYGIIKNMLEFTGALRLDKSSRLEDLVLSPRAAVVYKPLKDQTFRLTYNRAFSTPGTNEMFLDIVAANVKGLFDVRATGSPQSGFTFQYQNGKPLMSTYNQFGGAQIGGITLDSAATKMWPALKVLMKANGFNIDAIPAPPPGLVGVDLRMLNTVTSAFDPVGLNAVGNRGPIKPQITSTIELGYNGVIADRVALSLDLYTSHYKDFVGPLQTITPTVFLQQAALQQYLQQVFTAAGDTNAAQNATLLSGVISGRPSDTFLPGIPLGTISPSEVADRSAVYLTYRNYGDITIYGLDFSAQVAITNELSVSGTMSYVDKNFFKNLDNVSDLALNTPKFKYSVAAEYRNNDLGLGMTARLRHLDGFQINSGVYVGSIPGYSVVDLNVNYQIAAVPGLTVGVVAQNLLTFVENYTGSDGPFSLRHSEFVGTPALGRLVLGRLTYAFQ